MKKIRFVWGLTCVLMLLLIWSSIFAKIHYDCERLHRNAVTHVSFHAKNFAVQVESTVRHIDQILLTMKYQWEQSGSLDLADQYAKALHNTPTYPLAIDAKGIVISAWRHESLGLDMSQQPFFLYHQRSTDTNLRINPISMGLGFLAGKTVLRFTRRVNRADGSMLGVLGVAIDPSYLSKLSDEFENEKRGDLTALRILNGPLIALKSDHSAEVKETLYPEPPVFTEAEGVRIEPAEKFMDGQSRLIGWSTINEYPLVSLVAITEESLINEYAETKATFLLVGAFVSALILLGAGTGMIFQLRDTHRRRHVDQVQSTFRLAVDGAREAFYMVRPLRDENNKVIDYLIEDCNERAALAVGRRRTDLIGKPSIILFSKEEVSRMHNFLDAAMREGFVEEEVRVKEGSSFKAGWYQRRAVRSGEGIAVTVRDLTDAKKQKELVLQLAITDALTGLPNRHWMNQYLEGALSRAQMVGNSVALLFIDLDNFKKINDTLGHKAGDDLLIAAASCLRNAVRASDHVVRLGGDEFTIIIENIDSATSIETVAREVVEAIAESPDFAEWSAYSVRCSVGIALYPEDAQTASSLLQCADIAMYAAKSSGKGKYLRFKPEMAEKINEKISIEQTLAAAIKQNQFVLHYQPLICTSTGALCGMEALIRWSHPVRGLLSPDQFIAVAEENRLILPLGEWVVSQVCAQIAAWRALQKLPPRVSFNVSVLQLKDGRFRACLQAALARHQLQASDIAIELTESTMVNSEDGVPAELTLLRSLGVELLIDDFGTGFSSLSLLQQLDIDAVKIDKSFVAALGTDPQSDALCAAMISIGRALNILVVAEGVETLDQLHALQKLGCDEIQGFLISPPVDADNMLPLLEKGSFLPEFFNSKINAAE